MNRVSRRQVLKCAAGVAGTFGIPYFIPSGVLAADDKPGANERVTVGASGVGNRASPLLDHGPLGGAVLVCEKTSRSATGRSAFATWPTSPAGSAGG